MSEKERNKGVAIAQSLDLNLIAIVTEPKQTLHKWLPGNFNKKNKATPLKKKKKKSGLKFLHKDVGNDDIIQKTISFHKLLNCGM